MAEVHHSFGQKELNARYLKVFILLLFNNRIDIILYRSYS